MSSRIIVYLHFLVSTLVPLDLIIIFTFAQEEMKVLMFLLQREEMEKNPFIKHPTSGVELVSFQMHLNYLLMAFLSRGYLVFRGDKGTV